MNTESIINDAVVKKRRMISAENTLSGIRGSMKRIIVILLLLVLPFSAVSCNRENEPTPTGVHSYPATETDTVSTTQMPENTIEVDQSGSSATVSVCIPEDADKEASVVILKKGSDMNDENSILAIGQITLDKEGKATISLPYDYDGEMTVRVTSEAGIIEKEVSAK